MIFNDKNSEIIIFLYQYGFLITSRSAYVAIETKLYGAKIDGLLPPNFL